MKTFLKYLIIAVALVATAASANADSLATTPKSEFYEIENFIPQYEMLFGETQTKRVVIVYSGNGQNLKGSIKGSGNIDKVSGLKKLNTKRYYFDMELRGVAVGTHKYVINLNDAVGNTSSNTLLVAFNVKVQGLTFGKFTVPKIEKNYTDYTVKIPYEFKSDVQYIIQTDKPEGVNIYPITLNKYSDRETNIKFYLDKLQKSRIKVIAKSVEASPVVLGTTYIDINPVADKALKPADIMITVGDNAKTNTKVIGNKVDTKREASTTKKVSTSTLASTTKTKVNNTISKIKNIFTKKPTVKPEVKKVSPKTSLQNHTSKSVVTQNQKSTEKTIINKAVLDIIRNTSY